MVGGIYCSSLFQHVFRHVNKSTTCDCLSSCVFNENDARGRHTAHGSRQSADRRNSNQVFQVVRCSYLGRKIYIWALELVCKG
jgi:hypothetical protein